MSDRRLRILQVGSTDVRGGAAVVAGNLLRGYRARGCAASLAVGRKTGLDPDVVPFPDDNRRGYFAGSLTALRGVPDRMANRLPGWGWGRINRWLRFATHPRALLEVLRGREDFEFPATNRLLDIASAVPDIVHCHNLHGSYFDLRALAEISRSAPTVLTLHDAWMLSGHCAHAFDCDRWKTGCGECPDLTIPPAIRRDATADNWRRKRDIYAHSRLYVATPCEWLAQRVRQSMMAPALRDMRVIPNGIDLSVFQPSTDRLAIRRGLGVLPDAHLVLVVAVRGSGPWRDQDMLLRAGQRLAHRAAADAAAPRPKPVVFLVVGGEMPGALTSAVTQSFMLRCLPYETEPARMARYYQAADVYLHLARADTFPTTILEALACGTPVVATAVGGIPEQIRHADTAAIRSASRHHLGKATGSLVPPGDAGAAAEAIDALSVPAAAAFLRSNAAGDARARFDVNRQIERYLDWYPDIIDDWTTHPAPSSWTTRSAV